MSADFIITNARVITMDDDLPFAEAVAVKANTIVAVGSAQAVLNLQGPSTRIINADGRTVMPGFIESHVHIFMGAGELDNLDLSGVEGLEELTRRVRAYAPTKPDAKLLYANQVSYSVLGGTRLPDRHDLDRIISDRPFAMMTYDHHTVFANTAALKLAGVLNGAEVPVGSEIVMGADGLCTGELREPGAFRYILALTPTKGRDTLGFTDAAEPSPAPTPAERTIDRAVLLRGLKYCAGFGITSLHNLDGNFYTLELLQEIDEAGDFACRAQSPYHFKNYFPVKRLDEAVEMGRRFTSERVSSGRVKFFMDGVLESWTALRLTPYPDRPGHLGDPNYTAEEWNEICIYGDKLGLQLNVHAIADGAVRRTIDGYEAARKANGARDSRHRIEHIEMIDPADLPRLKPLGIVVSMQPTHAPGSVFPMEPGRSRMTKEEFGRSYAWRDVQKTGVPMCFNSDWPVAPLDPMISISAALTRKPYFEGATDQSLDLMSVLKGYTSGGAYAEFMEHRKGKLKVGMLADLVMLSGDIEKTDPHAIVEMKALLTMSDGRITHQA